MKNVKRILCMLIAIAMVFSMAACGNAETESIVDLGGDEQWDVNNDVNVDVDVNVDGSASSGATDTQSSASNAQSATQSGATQSGATQSGATQSGATQSGTTNQGATPNNQGANNQATPNNQGANNQATPNNQGANNQATPNNQGANNQAKPNNQGANGQATPNNQGTNNQATPNNQGTKPNTQTNNQTNQGAQNNQTNQGAQNNQTNNSTNQGAQSTPTNKPSTPTVQTPATQNADSLEWKALLAQMPQTLRGSVLNVCSWNPIKDVTGAESVISNFEKQTGIKVQWTQKSYDTYEQDILAMINSGTAPDIMRYNHPTPAKMSLCQDLRAATGYDFAGDIWDKNAINAFTVKGKLYGINLKNTFNQQPTVVTYSMATINRYKLEDPYVLWKEGKWTYQKFVEMCKDFKEETGRPAWMTSGHTEAFWFNNVNSFTFDGEKYKNNVNDPSVLKALQQAANFMADGLVCEAMREHDKLENGTYLFFTTNILATRRTDFHFSTLKANDDLYAVPVPTGFSSDGKYYQHYQEFEAYGIPKGARNPQAVYYFLRYYLNADNYDEDMFFVNNQTLETYKYCMSQKNIHYSLDLSDAITMSVGGVSDFIRTGGTAAQAKNKVDELAPEYERATKLANETIAKF